MWTVQFFNMAILLLVVNYKYNKIDLGEKSPILKGKYKDFTGGWYGDVGSAIVITVFLTSLSPIMNMVFWGFTFCLRCCDRKCTMDPRRTRKLLQLDYEKRYIGPRFQIENRYSVLIAMTLVVVSYTAAIPVLNFAGLIICVAQYWTDKVMFLRYYQKPPNYTKQLIYSAVNLMEYGVVLHMLFGLFMLTNPLVFKYRGPFKF